MTTTHIEIPRWTAAEFERLVLDCKPKTAIFDCDGTIWRSDSGYGFMVWSMEQGLVSRSTRVLSRITSRLASSSRTVSSKTLL